MPYYLFCSRCNEDGSYQNINSSCKICYGTGNDWRDDEALETYHRWAGIHITDLKRDGTRKALDGTPFFYAESFPPVGFGQPIAPVNKKSNVIPFKPIQRSSEYDFYIEPCQLCISRSGATHATCGWCNDSDTCYRRSDGSYPGNWVKISKDDGYPFHELPHKTRRYYRNGTYLEGWDGAVPPEISPADARGAQARNSAASELLSMLRSGEIAMRCPFTREIVEDFLQVVEEVYMSAGALKQQAMDISGKVEFRYLAFSLSSSSKTPLQDSIATIRCTCSNRMQWKRFLQDMPQLIQLCEVLIHEAFHILQAITLPTVGLRFDAAREICLLQWCLVEDFFLDRNKKAQLGVELLNLLLEADENSELYDEINRRFDRCRGDIEIIKQYAVQSKISGLSIFDLIEGQAFAFQKLTLYPHISVHELHNAVNSYPQVYGKALSWYINNNGEDVREFLLLLDAALKYGLIVDEEFLNSPFQPTAIFGSLCALKKKSPSIFSLKAHDASHVEILNCIRGICQSPEIISSLRHERPEAIQRFHELAASAVLIERAVSGIFAQMGIDSEEYKKLCQLSDILRNSRPTGNGRLKAVRQAVVDSLAISTEELLYPLLLSCNFTTLGVLFRMNDVANAARYEGLFGEDVEMYSENMIIDLLGRLDAFFSSRTPLVFCCEQHGMVNKRKILMGNSESCFNNIIVDRFERELSDMFINPK